MTDEQLDQKVMVVSETDSLPLTKVWVLEKDHVNPYDGMEPVSAYADDPNYTENPPNSGEIDK